MSLFSKAIALLILKSVAAALVTVALVATNVYHVRKAERLKTEVKQLKSNLEEAKGKADRAVEDARLNSVAVEDCLAANRANLAEARFQTERAERAERRLGTQRVDANRRVLEIQNEARKLSAGDCVAFDDGLVDWLLSE